ERHVLGCWHRLFSSLKPVEPLLRRLRTEAAEQAGTDRGVVVDVVDRQILVGTVPDVGEDLVVAGPGLEALLIPRPLADEPFRPRTALGIAPDRGEPGGRLVDEVAKVVLPAPV